MAIIRRKRRDGTFSYQVKVRDPEGNWYDSSTFDDIDDAKQEENRLESLKIKGQRRFSREAKTVTVDEYWSVWSADRRTDTSEGWKISQDQMYRDYVKPALGNLKMIEVDAPMIGKALNRVHEMGLSAQTRKHVYSLLRVMFGDAVEYYEMLAANPVKPKHHRPKVKRKKRNFLHPKQALHLLQVARAHRYLGPPIWVETLSGLRTEAMQGLQWKAVLWDLNQILICRAWKQKEDRMAEYPKNGDWEYVPLPPMLKEYLWEKWLASKQDPNDFVCPGVKGGMLPYETYLRAVKRMCQRAGLPVVTPHELRHSCTELWVQAGASREDIRRLLNHATSSTATDAYIHRTDDRLQSLAEKVGLRVIEGGNVFPKMFPNGNKETSAETQENSQGEKTRQNNL